MTANAIALASLLAALIAGVLISVRSSWRPGEGALVALIIAVLFGAGTVVPIVTMGPLGFWAEHMSDAWGVQIWADLLIALISALFLLVPRARAAGISPLPWFVLIAASGSIGLLLMMARILFNERQLA